MENKTPIFLIILYNRLCSESDTVCTLLPQIEHNRLILWDNKPVFEKENKLFIEQFTNNYYHILCKENFPLSRIYRSLIEETGSSGNNYLVLLDHDSKLANNYVSELSCLIKPHPNTVFVPNIYVKGEKYSPACMWQWFGWNCKGTPKPKYFSAINSGIALPARTFYLKKFEYPDGIKNYGTDVFLFRFIKKHRIPIVIMKSKIEHDLTMHNNNHNEQTYFPAWCEHVKAVYIIFCKDSFGLQLLYYMYVLAKSIILAIKRKQSHYLNLSNYIK